MFISCSRMAERIVPSWDYTLDLVKKGSQEVLDCEAFECAPKN